MDTTKYDVIIIGAGLSGLVAAYTLSSFGIKCCLLDKNDKIGGGNSSFKNEFGDIFDSGYHALDESRSHITTALFKKVVGNFHRKKLSRGIVLNSHVFPYNSDIKSWPKELSSLLDLSDIDDIGTTISAENLSSVYGPRFIEYCKNNIFQSYPSEVRASIEGRDKNRMFDLIYPWFFPKLMKKSIDGGEEWAQYHGKMRNQDQFVLYPKENGFYGFVESLYRAINKDFCDIYLGCTDLQLKLNNENHCESISFLDKSLIADHYFWCAPFFGLAPLLNIKLPSGVPQRLALGSFRLKDDLSQPYHEILVGDINHDINRISFPGYMRSEKNNLIQVEFLFPDGEYPIDSDFWKTSWLNSLKDMNIIDNSNVELFDFEVCYRGMVTKHPLDEISKEYDKKFKDSNTNIFLPFVNAGPENINRLVPAVINNTIDFIYKKGI
jgi:hypothetical protein